jgi:hypothetical protein
MSFERRFRVFSGDPFAASPLSQIPSFLRTAFMEQPQCPTSSIGLIGEHVTPAQALMNA